MLPVRGNAKRKNAQAWGPLCSDTMRGKAETVSAEPESVWKKRDQKENTLSMKKPPGGVSRKRTRETERTYLGSTEKNCEKGFTDGAGQPGCVKS